MAYYKAHQVIALQTERDTMSGGRKSVRAQKPVTVRRNFDSGFYERFYENPRTACTSRSDAKRLVRFVLHYLDFLRIPVRTVLDMGCGVGLWRDAIESCEVTVAYTGVEASEYLCGKYGWQQGCIVDFKTRRRYDLVVCQSVLQYLDKDDVSRAIANLARLCRGALYVEAPTREDLRDGIIDRKRTDCRIHFRSGRWYKQRLTRYFTSCGGGVFVPTDGRATLYELEKAR